MKLSLSFPQVIPHVYLSYLFLYCFPFSAISFSGAGLSTSEAEKNTEQRSRDKPEKIQPDRRLNPPDAAVFLAQFFHIKQKNPPSAHYMRAGRGLDAESAAGIPAQMSRLSIQEVRLSLL